MIFLVCFSYSLLAIFLAWKLCEYFRWKKELEILDDYTMGNVWKPGIARALEGEHRGKPESVALNSF